MMRMSLILTIFTFISSCSFNRMAVRSSASLLDEASLEMETEKNWEVMRYALPANIKMIEGLLSIDPKNEKLLLAVTKAYVAMGFGVSETLNLEDKLQDKDDSENRIQAIYHYSKALTYGLISLQLKGIKFEDLTQIQDSQEIRNLLKTKIRNEAELNLLFFTAQAWGSLINLQRTNIPLFAQLNNVKNLMDYVCELKPDINFGACTLFYGAYEVGRPKMLGGDPEKGKKIFNDFITQNPQNLLARVMMLEYLVIPQQDKELFDKEMAILENKAIEFKQSMNYGASVMIQQVSKDRLNVYNSIAIKRYEIFSKLKNKLF